MYSNITLNNSPNYSQTNTKDLINIEDDIEFSTYIDEIIAYLKTYFNFFSSRHFGKSVDIIHIIGRISMINNIENIFKKTFNIECKTGLILEKSNSKYINSDFSYNNELTVYSSNIGLLLREGKKWTYTQKI